LALEVKRQESDFKSTWWQQVVKAAGPDRVPVLMWRRNHQPWRFRVLAPVVTGQWQTPKLAMDMTHETFPVWFEYMLRWHRQ
jgi:hypothetical protein